jgi:dTDP-4-amino-4,6-dideoxygalactose transaminase
MNRKHMPELALYGGKPVRKAPFPPWPSPGKEERKALLAVLSSGTWGIGGKEIERLEKRFARMHGVAHGVAVMNGTVALEIALKAGRIGDGDEVIVPSYTFAATATAVLNVNAIPVFADIDPDTYCIDPQSVRGALSPRTKAIIPVHFAGHPADMDALTSIASDRSLFLIEDAAQAHLAAWGGQPVGSFGHIGTFSFQSSKNITSGEGGIILTNDDSLAERCWSYHNCGRSPTREWYHHPRLGGNYRMTQFQAALVLAQLTKARVQHRTRQRNAQYLASKLHGLPGITPLRVDARVTHHAYHLFVIRYDREQCPPLERSTLLKALQAEGIPASSGYVPLYREGFLKEAGEFTLRNHVFAGRQYSEVHCPNTERACTAAIWLPQNVLLGSKRDLDDIVRAFEKILAHKDEVARAGS